jgi:hypothetical protein
MVNRFTTLDRAADLVGALQHFAVALFEQWSQQLISGGPRLDYSWTIRAQYACAQGIVVAHIAPMDRR